MNYRAQFCLVALITILAITTPAAAQTAAAGDQGRGLATYTLFQGSADSQGQVMKWDSSLGYNFNQHFGVDFGVPVYFVRNFGTSTTSAGWNNGIGNVYLDARAKFKNPTVNYSTILTGYVPTGDSSKGMSTGRGTFDWSNHFDRGFGRLTPFGDIGIGDTITDTRFFTRPFTTLGFDTHMEGGARYDLGKIFSVGASGYAVLPSGQQKVFSKLLQRGAAGTAGSGRHGRVFETSAETTGTAGIARDDGFSTWVSATPSRYIYLELGYTRSVGFDLNTVSFGIGINVGRMLKASRN